MKKYELEVQLQNQMEELQNQKIEDKRKAEEICSEWNWTLSDKEVQTVNNIITINKGKIVEVKTVETIETINNDKEIERLKAKIKDYDKMLGDEMNEREEWEEKYNKLSSYCDKIWEEKEQMKKELKAKTIVDKEKEELLKLREEKEQLEKELKTIRDENRDLKREIEALKSPVQAEEIIMTDEYNAKHIIGAKGKITIDGKPYVFLANNRHTSPTVFFCMDKETIDKAETLILNNCSGITFGYLTDENNNTKCILKNDNVIYDFDNNIVVWKKEDGTFAGYTDKFAFYWDGTSEFVTGKTKEQVYSEAYNPFATTKGNRAMNKSWGRTAALEGQRIKDYLENLKNTVVEENTIEKPEIEITEEVVEITIEKPKVERTEEEANFTIDDSFFTYDDDDFDDSKAFLY